MQFVALVHPSQFWVIYALLENDKIFMLHKFRMMRELCSDDDDERAGWCSYDDDDNERETGWCSADSDDRQ